MKKLLLSMSLAFCFIGCNRVGDAIPAQTDAPSKLETSIKSGTFESGLTKIYKEAISVAARQKLIFKDYQFNQIGVYVYDPVKALGNLPDSIDNIVFAGGRKINLPNARVSSVQNLPVVTVQSIVSVIQNSEYPYSALQKTMMIDLINTLFSHQDPISAADGVLFNFMLNVHTSSGLTTQQQNELLNYATGIMTLTDFFQAGGIDQIADGIVTSNSSARNARTAGCQLNTRGILIGAVIQGTIGAIGGAKAGAVGGTFTIPGLGTVTGAVGGAVFGGALGFASGAVTSIAGQLFETCTRYVTSADCQEIMHNYFSATNPTTKRNLMNNHPQCFKIEDRTGGNFVFVTPAKMDETESLVISKYQGVQFLY
jgi:hypothetical protein